MPVLRAGLQVLEFLVKYLGPHCSFSAEVEEEHKSVAALLQGSPAATKPDAKPEMITPLMDGALPLGGFNEVSQPRHVMRDCRRSRQERHRCTFDAGHATGRHSPNQASGVYPRSTASGTTLPRHSA